MHVVAPRLLAVNRRGRSPFQWLVHLVLGNALHLDENLVFQVATACGAVIAVNAVRAVILVVVPLDLGCDFIGRQVIKFLARQLDCPLLMLGGKRGHIASMLPLKRRWYSS